MIRRSSIRLVAVALGLSLAACTTEEEPPVAVEAPVEEVAEPVAEPATEKVMDLDDDEDVVLAAQAPRRTVARAAPVRKAPAPEPEPEIEAEPPPPLLPMSIEDGVGRYSSHLNICVTSARRRNPEMSGRVDVTILVKDGRVHGASVVGNTTGDTSLETCIPQKIRRWRFDDTVSDQVTWPFVFRSK